MKAVLERLTCAYFSVAENDTAPCALGYGYDPIGNGNLTTKSDVGTLVYGDPMHPHAVTGAGTDSFGYDAVGNQTTRPGGATVSYTPFDLPSTITQSTGTASGHTNIVRVVEGRLLRITTAVDDTTRIISVGPLHRSGLFNGIVNGRFNPSIEQEGDDMLEGQTEVQARARRGEPETLRRALTRLWDDLTGKPMSELELHASVKK